MRPTAYASSFCWLTLLAGTALSAVGCGDKKAASNASPACTPPAISDFAANNPNSCSSEMFGKYQLGAFAKVNSDIIAMAANPNQVPHLGDTFQTHIVEQGQEKIDTFTSHLAAFLIDAYGKTTDPNYIAYPGEPMTTAHAGLNITTAQYNYFVSDVIVPVLTADGVSASDITNCFAPVVLDPNLMVQIVTCK